MFYITLRILREHAPSDLSNNQTGGKIGEKRIFGLRALARKAVSIRAGPVSVPSPGGEADDHR